MSDQKPMRDDDAFKQYLADHLRKYDERLKALESQNVEMALQNAAILKQNAETLEIIRTGRTFFKLCRWLGIGLKWLAGVVTSVYMLGKIFQATHGTPPPPPGVH